MSDQTSIFNQEQSSTQTQQTTAPSNGGNSQVQDQLANLLNDIKNERGEPKYKDPLEALNGLKHAQEYIPQLKEQVTAKDREIAEMRTKLEQMASLEETVQQLTQKREQEQTQTQPAAITPEQIAEMVNSQLKQREAVQTQQANINVVKSALQQSFGADAEKKLYGKAQELGLTVEEMNTLVATKPKAVLALLGAQGGDNKQSVTPSTSSVNSAAFQPLPQSYIGQNPDPILVGATNQDLMKASQRANKMVEQLHEQGLTMQDLTNPKIFAKYFQQG